MRGEGPLPAETALAVHRFAEDSAASSWRDGSRAIWAERDARSTDSRFQ